MSHTCDGIREWLSAYLDNELNARRRAEVEAHLRECASCREEFAILRRLSAVMQCWQAPAVDPQISVAFAERLATRQAIGARRRVTVWALGSMVVLALAVLLIAWPFAQKPREVATVPSPPAFERTEAPLRAKGSGSLDTIAPFVPPAPAPATVTAPAAMPAAPMAKMNDEFARTTVGSARKSGNRLVGKLPYASTSPAHALHDDPTVAVADLLAEVTPYEPEAVATDAYTVSHHDTPDDTPEELMLVAWAETK